MGALDWERALLRAAHEPIHGDAVKIGDTKKRIVLGLSPQFQILITPRRKFDLRRNLGLGQALFFS